MKSMGLALMMAVRKEEVFGSPCMELECEQGIGTSVDAALDGFPLS